MSFLGFQVVYFVATFPYIVMTIMLIRGVTLEGAGEGVKFYIEPKADGLTKAQVFNNFLEFGNYMTISS